MELKANELRIGNWVYRKDIGDGHIRTESILEICNNRVICSGPFKVSCKLNDIYPIPLTEEWLIRFGFEKDKMFFEFSIHTTRINIVLFPISPKNEEYQVRINNSTTQIFIKYVHQLQNLYFALTGEELELSPK